MRNYFKIFTIIFISAFTFLSTSCKDDNEESCSAKETDVGNCSAEDITICCDDAGDCYYVYKGTDYSEDDIAAVCSPSGSYEDIQLIKIQLDDITKQLIQNARTAAVCN